MPKTIKFQEGGIPPEAMPEQGGQEDIAGQILGDLDTVITAWETAEYESDEQRWQSYTEDIINVIQKYKG